MKKLTVTATYDLHDWDTDEVLGGYHSLTFKVTGKTHEEAVENAYNQFYAIACEIERDTGAYVTGNYRYTEEATR